MFEYAVVGPIGKGGLGIVRQCIECRAVAGPDAPACNGFGPGCLVSVSRDARAPAPTSPSEPVL